MNLNLLFERRYIGGWFEDKKHSDFRNIQEDSDPQFEKKTPFYEQPLKIQNQKFSHFGINYDQRILHNCFRNSKDNGSVYLQQFKIKLKRFYEIWRQMKHELTKNVQSESDPVYSLVDFMPTGKRKMGKWRKNRFELWSETNVPTLSQETLKLLSLIMEEDEVDRIAN